MRYAFIPPLLAALCGPAPAADVPRPSPAFTFQRIGAPDIRLSQYRGKVVALAFILTTCPHCQQLTTELKLVARDYPTRDVQFLECAFHGDALAALPEFLDRFQAPFPIGYNTQIAVMAYLRYSPVDPRPLYAPHMLFLDRAGVIRAEYPGQSDFFRDPNANIRTQLDKLLKKPAPKKKPASAQ